MALHVLVDSSASMGFGAPRKFDHARRIAAALAFIGLNNLDRVSMTAFDTGVGLDLPALKSRHHMSSLLSFLRDLPCAGATRYAPALREFATRARSPGLVSALSDQ